MSVFHRNRRPSNEESMALIPRNWIRADVLRRLKALAKAGHEVWCYQSGPGPSRHVNLWFGGGVNAKIEVLPDGTWKSWSDYGRGGPVNPEQVLADLVKEAAS